MSEFETDPAQQSVTKIGRSAALAASLLAERIARIRSDLAVAERTRQQERATQLRRTYEAQRDAARAELRTADPQWLRTATTSELAHAWRAAEVWSRVEPDVFTPDRDRIGQVITRRVGVDVARLPVDEATKRLDELAAHEHATAAAHRTAERQDEGRATALAVAGLIEDADLARDTARGQASEAAAAERRGDAMEATGRDEQWRERLVQRVERAGLTHDQAVGIARASRGNQQSVEAATKSPARGRVRAGTPAPRRRERGIER